MSPRDRYGVELTGVEDVTSSDGRLRRTISSSVPRPFGDCSAAGKAVELRGKLSGGDCVEHAAIACRLQQESYY